MLRELLSFDARIQGAIGKAKDNLDKIVYIGIPKDIQERIISETNTINQATGLKLNTIFGEKVKTTKKFLIAIEI